jgi:hypothetical protein
MAIGINVNNLPAKAAASITTNDQVMLFNATETTQTPFNEAVAQANVLNGCLCVKTLKVTVPSASVLLFDSVPYSIPISTAVGKYVKLLSVDLFMNYGGTAYVSLSPLLIFPVTGDLVFSLPAYIIDAAQDIFVSFTPVAATANQEQMVNGVAGYEIISLGAITTGNSPLDLFCTYVEIDM